MNKNVLTLATRLLQHFMSFQGMPYFVPAQGYQPRFRRNSHSTTMSKHREPSEQEKHLRKLEASERARDQARDRDAIFAATKNFRAHCAAHRKDRRHDRNKFVQNTTAEQFHRERLQKRKDRAIARKAELKRRRLARRA